MDERKFLVTCKMLVEVSGTMSVGKLQYKPQPPVQKHLRGGGRRGEKGRGEEKSCRWTMQKTSGDKTEVERLFYAILVDHGPSGK